MKKSILNLFILLFMSLVLQQNSFSQTAFSISPIITTYNHFGVDISNNSFVIPFPLTLQNDSTEQIKIRWNRIMGEDCTSEWEWETQDENLFFTNNLTSNIDDSLGTYSPLDMDSGEIDEQFRLLFSPNTTNGCCNFRIEFTEVDYPEKLLAVAYFDVRLNATNSNCQTTSNENLEKTTIIFFPNPVKDFFIIISEKAFDKIEIRSLNGQLLKSYPYSSSKEYDLTNFSPGIYTLSILSKETQTQVFKLVKIDQ